MAEFTIDSFVASLREKMYQLFPYENDEINRVKHKNRPEHIRDIAFNNLPVMGEGDVREFNIGSEQAEEKYPYYHILQQAPVIRKRDRGTKKSKGSQAEVKNLGQRDYERIKWDGKTFKKEYTKNVRGSRNSVVQNSTRYIYMGGSKIQINRQANSYVNIHYQYIDQMLDVIAPMIASEFGMTFKRKVNTGLQEEYQWQNDQDNNWFFDMFDSFN